jgi:uncharacterized membrane protein
MFRRNSKHVSTVISLKFLFWYVGLFIAAFVLASFGLYDFRDQRWHAVLLYAPLICAVMMMAGRSIIRKAWSEQPAKEKRALIWHALAFALMLTGITWVAGRGREATLTVYNEAPYPITIAVRYQANRLDTLTEGYWTVPPGKSQIIKRKFLRQEPQFHVFSANKDNLDAWLQSSETAPRWDFDKYERLVAAYSPDASVEGQDETAQWDSATLHTVIADPSLIKNPVAEDDRLVSAFEDRPRGSLHKAPFIEVPAAAEKGDTYKVWFSRGGQDAKVTVCNLFPYRVKLPIHYQSKRAEWITEAPQDIEAGECRTFELNFQGVEPNLYKHTAITGELEKWHLNRNGADEWMTTKENSAVGDVVISACVGQQTLAVNSPEQIQTCGDGETLRHFVQDQAPLDDTIRLLHSAALPVPKNKDGIIDVEKAKSEAKALRTQLYVQMVNESWFRKVRINPYLIGPLSLERETPAGEHFRGVVVAEALQTTPFGKPVPVFPGEEIIEFDEKPIFNAVDLDIAVIKFAESREKGILKPFTIVVRRGNETITRKGCFFFNEAAYVRTARTYEQAQDYGWKIGTSLAGSPIDRVCQNNPDRDCRWQKTQEFWLLRQLHPDAYEKGRLQGALTQGALTFIAVPVVVRFLRALFLPRLADPAVAVAEAAVGLALPVVEFATMARYEAPPGADIHAEVREAASLGAKIGVATILMGPLTSRVKLPPAKSFR